MRSRQNVIRQYQQAQLNARAAQVDPSVRATIAQAAVAGQQAIDDFKYWSTVRFAAVRTGAGPYTYTLAQRQRKAFSYGAGQDASSAGFASGYRADLQDTNINQPSQTNDNCNFTFNKINCLIRQSKFVEPQLIAEIFRVCDVQLQMSGQLIYRVGTLDKIPGGGGLYGAQPSLVTPGAVNTSQGAPISYLSNSNPQGPSAYELEGNPITWNAVGGGQKDSALTLLVTQNEEITITGSDRAAAAGVEAFTAASTIYVDLTFYLTGEAVSNRSHNA